MEMYIAKHNLSDQEMEKLLDFISEDRFSKLLLKLSDKNNILINICIYSIMSNIMDNLYQNYKWSFLY